MQVEKTNPTQGWKAEAGLVGLRNTQEPTTAGVK